MSSQKMTNEFSKYYSKKHIFSFKTGRIQSKPEWPLTPVSISMNRAQPLTRVSISMNRAEGA